MSLNQAVLKAMACKSLEDYEKKNCYKKSSYSNPMERLSQMRKKAQKP